MLFISYRLKCVSLNALKTVSFCFLRYTEQQYLKNKRTYAHKLCAIFDFRCPPLSASAQAGPGKLALSVVMKRALVNGFSFSYSRRFHSQKHLMLKSEFSRSICGLLKLLHSYTNAFVTQTQNEIRGLISRHFCICFKVLIRMLAAPSLSNFMQ